MGKVLRGEVKEGKMVSEVNRSGTGYEFEGNLIELQAICRALNILVYKTPLSANWLPEDQAAELQDKNILIYWDKDKQEFLPGLGRGI